MKSDIVMYEKVYQVIKNKIVCGLLPHGVKLPSRANLCQEFSTSEKTVRHALEKLSQEGLIETTQRKRPTVIFDRCLGEENVLCTMAKVDATVANDVLKTGILLCYPTNSRGMALCRGEDWHIPEAMIEKMDPQRPTEFWRLSSRVWRYFIARNGNELMLRAVDSLGFGKLDPLPGTLDMRTNYLTNLRQLIQTMKRGGNPSNVRFDDLFVLYGFLPDEFLKAPTYTDLQGVDAKGLERQLYQSQERYSSVYLDLLSLITIGRYQPGDRLPSHEELRRIYGVSIDTTIKAVQTLQDWGVVTATRGKGIFVAMDLEGLKKIHIPPELVACHVRRFMDSLELISLTIEGVAAHAAAYVTAEEARWLYHEIDFLWHGPYLYQLSPYVLLNFLVEHIHYDALKVVYRVIKNNYHIGRSIPKLINRVKNANCQTVYQQCMLAVSYLREGEPRRFARKAAEMFQYTHQLIITECKRLGYWEAAMRVYDGTALWRR